MEKIYQTQSKLFKILSHPTRLLILDILRSGEQCVCHIEAISGLRQAHISQHLMVLREAGLVTDRRDGWNIFYRASQPEIYMLLDEVNAFLGLEKGNFIQKIGARPQRKACPCPKCNPERDDYSCEPDQKETVSQ